MQFGPCFSSCVEKVAYLKLVAERVPGGNLHFLFLQTSRTVHKHSFVIVNNNISLWGLSFHSFAARRIRIRGFKPGIRMRRATNKWKPVVRSAIDNNSVFWKHYSRLLHGIRRALGKFYLMIGRVLKTLVSTSPPFLGPVVINGCAGLPWVSEYRSSHMSISCPNSQSTASGFYTISLEKIEP